MSDDPPADDGDAIEVVEAADTDVEAVGAFFREAWRSSAPEAPGWTGASEAVIEEISRPDAIRPRIGGPDRRMFIALQSGRVVGMAATRVLDVTTVELAGITVLQTLLGRGIGTPLLEAAIRSADESGFERMVVKTEADNERALAFYGNRGFVATRTFVEDVEGVPIELTALTRTL